METPLPPVMDSRKLVYSYEYPRPAVTVDLVVVSLSEETPHCIMVRRGKEPYKGMWAIPGGFLNEGETTLEAAVRELKEETGYDILHCDGAPTLLGVYDQPNRDPRGRVISVVYLLKTRAMLVVRGMDDAAEAAWLPMKIGNGRLAFDHAQIIRDALRKLRSV